MKIHVFVRSIRAQGGGSHHNSIAYIRLLKEQGHTVTVHAFSSIDNHPPSDIEVEERTPPKHDFLSFNRLVCEMLTENESDADAYLIFSADSIWGAGMYKWKGGKVPALVYLDNYLPSMGMNEKQSFIYYLKRLGWDALIGKKYARRVDCFLAVSPYIRDVYIKFGLPKEKFRILPNFFELPHQEKQIQTAHDNTVHLLYAGRVIADKGIDQLIRALHKVKVHNWHLRIVGDGPLKQNCIELLKELNLSDQVTFVPWIPVEDLWKEYVNADIFIHPARWPEPFGRTLVEALSYGVPVIATRYGAAPWILGDAGLTFRNGDIHEMATDIELLIKDEILRRSLGKAGIEQVKMFAKEKIQDELSSVLGEITLDRKIS